MCVPSAALDSSENHSAQPLVPWRTMFWESKPFHFQQKVYNYQLLKQTVRWMLITLLDWGNPHWDCLRRFRGGIWFQDIKKIDWTATDKHTRSSTPNVCLPCTSEGWCALCSQTSLTRMCLYALLHTYIRLHSHPTEQWAWLVKQRHCVGWTTVAIRPDTTLGLLLPLFLPSNT